MSTELYRKYIDIINENSQDRIQLDEGMMDKFNPYIKKMANALMSKLDPETLKGLKQAYDQSGGDKNKFMQLVGITKQDLSPLVQANMSEGAFTGTGRDLKSKVLTALANIIPLTGILDFITGSNAYNMLKASGVEPLAFLWYCAAFALMWGIGHYNFDKELDKEQLDEGMLDSIKDKVMGVVNKFVSSSPKAKAAFDQAKQYKSELADILKTSSSGKEVVQKIGQLVGNQQLAEEITDESIGGLKTAAGGAMVILPTVAAVLDSLYANFDKIPETAMTYVLLLVIGAAGHLIMAKGLGDLSKGN